MPTERPIPKFGEPFELKVGESASFDNGKLNISFDSVSIDSRCPIGNACSDSGDAVVVLKVFNSRFSFHTNLWPRELTVETYNIELLSLSPYPVDNQPISINSYVAKLYVSEVILGSIHNSNSNLNQMGLSAVLLLSTQCNLYMFRPHKYMPPNHALKLTE